MKWSLAILLAGGLARLCSGPRQSAAAAAKVAGIAVPTLSWQMMRGLDYRTGEMTPELQALINVVVRVDRRVVRGPEAAIAVGWTAPHSGTGITTADIARLN